MLLGESLRRSERVPRYFRSPQLRVDSEYVVHSKSQYTAFGRHDVTDHSGWDHCDFAVRNEKGERRIRVIKGTEKVEGFWRQLKHSDYGIPEEVHNSDDRLNSYCQALIWRSQTVGDPFNEVCRMARAFRGLPVELKQYVFKYGLTVVAQETKDKTRAVKELPPVIYAEAPFKGSEPSDVVEGGAKD